MDGLEAAICARRNGCAIPFDREVQVTCWPMRGRSRTMLGRNKLNRRKRTQILGLLLAGNSLRVAGRAADVSHSATCRLFKDAATAFAELQDQAFRELKCRRLQLDEVWTFASAKPTKECAHKTDSAGDIWTWVAVDIDTKLVPSWRIGDRCFETAKAFVDDLKGRLADGVRITTEGAKAYLDATDGAFGDVDYAVLLDVYRAARNSRREHGSTKVSVGSNAARNSAAKSSSEGEGPTMRTSLDRLTRSTNALSKKIENHALSVALHWMHYNFCCVNEALRVTPAMAAKVTGRFWEIDDLVQVLENWERTR